MNKCEIKNKIGIYKITNPAGRVYIGQSINIERRFNEYKKIRCKGQRILYNSLVKYGYDSHIFEIIELCKKDELNQKELKYITLYDCFNNPKKGMNLKSGGESGGYHSDESKSKMRLAAINRTISEETRYKMKLARSNPNKQKRSIESRLKTSNSQKKIILDMQNGIYYFGVEDAANSYGIKPKTLKQRLNGYLKNKTNLMYV